MDLPSATDKMYSHSRNTQLKAHFGLNNLRIRGLTQVAQYLFARCLAYLAGTIVAHEVVRPDLKASPSRLLCSY